ARNSIHDDEVTNRSEIAPAISRAQNRFVLSEPRKIPAETDRRRKVVPVVSIDRNVGIRRVLSDEFHLRQPVRAVARDAAQRLSDGTIHRNSNGGAAALFIR